jgi:hypothetical protein
MGSTQSLTDMSTRSIFWGVKAARVVLDAFEERKKPLVPAGIETWVFGSPARSLFGLSSTFIRDD